MIKVIPKYDSQIHNFSISEFEKRMGIKWASYIEFETPKIEKDVATRCAKAIRKNAIDQQQKWLGIYFAKELKTPNFAESIIAWINSDVGYGLIAGEEIPKGTFIGEYTGLIRKRRGKTDRKNNYCFEYNFGESFWKSPYIIDAKEIGNHTRFINHSDRPNLEPISIYHQGAMHVIFIAKETILQGKEMHYQYGEQYWRMRAPPIYY